MPVQLRLRRLPWTIFYHDNNHDNNELTGISERRKKFFVNLELCGWFPRVSGNRRKALKSLKKFFNARRRGILRRFAPQDESQTAGNERRSRSLTHPRFARMGSG
jgi:hypothetical protein